AGARPESPASTARAMRALETQVLADVNRTRAERGIAPLRFSPKLAAAAAQHSSEMARRGYFSHSSANGEAFWRRVQRYYGPGSYRYWAVGENLLWQSPDIDAAAALELGKHSPEH